jgi:hypothetical protein
VHALKRPLAFAALVTAFTLAVGCRRTATPAECDALVDHFAELVVREKLPDAGADLVAAERARQRDEARKDEGFRACPEQMTRAQHACAMSATSSDALLACFE